MSLKVLLIAPPYPLEEAPSPPLGICYAASAFIKAGAEVKLIDYIVSGYEKESLEEELKLFNPDIVGTSSVTMNFYDAAAILEDVKEILPSATIAIGGPHVSFCAEETVKEYSFIDIVFKGEADQTIVEFSDLFYSRDRWKEIKGIVYRNDKELIDTGNRDFISDLDKLPLPARELLPISKYRALGFPVSIITSRGCPGRCIFCLGRKMVGQKVRKRSVKSVVDEIEKIIEMGFDFINIADDLFTADKKRVIEICDEIIRRDLKFFFSVFSRVNTIDYELLVTMKKAGLHAVSFGIESGNRDMLKRIRKGITLEQAMDAVDACRRAGVRSHVSFMAGLPGETRETLKDSSRFQKKLGTEFGYHLLAPFPGTNVRDNIEEYDLEILTDDWNLYDAKRPVVKTSELDASDFKAFVDDSYRNILENWEDLLRRYKEGDASDSEIESAESYYRLNMIYTVLKENLIENTQSGSMDGICGILKKKDYDERFIRESLSSLIEKELIRVNGSKLNWT